MTLWALSRPHPLLPDRLPVLVDDVEQLLVGHPVTSSGQQTPIIGAVRENMPVEGEFPGSVDPQSPFLGSASGIIFRNDHVCGDFRWPDPGSAGEWGITGERIVRVIIRSQPITHRSHGDITVGIDRGGNPGHRGGNPVLTNGSNTFLPTTRPLPRLPPGDVHRVGPAPPDGRF